MTSNKTNKFQSFHLRAVSVRIRHEDKQESSRYLFKPKPSSANLDVDERFFHFYFQVAEFLKKSVATLHEWRRVTLSTPLLQQSERSQTSNLIFSSSLRVWPWWKYLAYQRCFVGRRRQSRVGVFIFEILPQAAIDYFCYYKYFVDSEVVMARRGAHGSPGSRSFYDDDSSNRGSHLCNFKMLRTENFKPKLEAQQNTTDML